MASARYRGSRMAVQRWRAAEILRLGIGEGEQLGYSRATRAARVLERPIAALLASCQAFRTLDEHARAAGNSAATRAQLQMLAHDGLLVEEAALRARLRAAPHPDADHLTISTVSVVTADRVASLRQCLSSYLDNAQAHQRALRLRVMDDARGPDARIATQQMLGALASERGAEIAYAGADEKRTLAAALGADGEIPQDVIDFALFDPEGCGRTTGANHNAQLLFCAGEAFLSVDDDSTARFAPIPGGDSALELSSGYHAPATWFYPDRAGAMKAVPFEHGDVIAIHERLLGRPVANCISEYSRDNDLLVDNLGSRLLRGIEQGHAEVLVTQTGLVGDAGTPNLPAVSRLTGESRDRLVRSEAAYRQAMRSREIVRGRSRLTMTDNPFLSTGPALALDNRRLLPAFFPVLRNTDGIFGLTLRATIESGCIAHLPWALEHVPSEDRPIPQDALARLASRSVTHEFITAAIHSFPSIPGGQGTRTDRIVALGRHLRAVGSLDNRAFLEFLRPWIWRAKSVAIAALVDDLATHDNRPAYWTADVHRYLDTLREALADSGYFSPADLPPVRGDADPGDLTRRLVRRFGELLTWWPAMVARAQRLRSDGRVTVKSL